LSHSRVTPGRLLRKLGYVNSLEMQETLMKIAGNGTTKLARNTFSWVKNLYSQIGMLFTSI